MGSILGIRSSFKSAKDAVQKLATFFKNVIFEKLVIVLLYAVFCGTFDLGVILKSYHDTDAHCPKLEFQHIAEYRSHRIKAADVSAFRIELLTQRIE